MKKLTKFQIKTIIISLFIGIASIVFGLYYLKSMTIKSSALNINKMIKKDKIYSYSIFSDFYYHITKYNETGDKISDFSKLIPIETSIGYDFSADKPKTVLTSRKIGKDMQLGDINGNKSSKVIDILEVFAKEYGKIITVQDQYYFNQSAKITTDILGKLYDNQNKIEPKSISNYYENKIVTPISNLKLKPYKLDKITKNLKKFTYCPPEKWEPNIAEWQFGEKDRIYLQYLEDFKSSDLEDYLDKTEKKNLTIIKITKTNNNKVKKFFFKYKKLENKIESFFMDSNGHIYILIFKANNPQSLNKYLHDYLKIAFGVYFEDTQNFSSDYIKKFKEIKNYLDEYKKIVNKEHEIHDDKLFYNYKLPEVYILTSKVLDLNLDEFLKHYNEYPNKEIIENEKKIFKQRLFLQCVKKKTSKLFYFGDKLMEKCSDLDCAIRFASEKDYTECLGILK